MNTVKTIDANRLNKTCGQSNRSIIHSTYQTNNLFNEEGRKNTLSFN